MAIMNVNCPNCGRRYQLNAPNPAALLPKTFQCKHCGSQTSFSRLFASAGINIQQSGAVGAGGMHTHIAGAPGGGMHTQIAGASGMNAGFGAGKTRVASAFRASLKVEGSGREIPIAEGIYILGRESSDSMATVKIAPDPYMSRQHARLNATACGPGLKCSITSFSQTNAMLINGRPVPAGMPAPLADGDRILLGMTTVTFKMK